MKIDTDIILLKDGKTKKYRVIISVEAFTSVIRDNGSKEDRKIENQSTLQSLLDEFISGYNKKMTEKYAFELQREQTIEQGKVGIIQKEE